MKYVAHLQEEREQTIKEHLEGTAKLSGEFAKKFGKEEWGYCCGYLHDIGKYSVEFQHKIRENGNEQIDHSTAGAKVCVEKGGLYPIMSYCIAGHHAGLPNYGSSQDGGFESTLMGRMKKTLKDYSAYQDEIEIPKVTTVPIAYGETKNPDFSLSVFIRMLYSCLVDADFLDTEAFMKKGEIKRDTGESIEILLQKLEKYVSKWLLNKEINTVNGRRTEILRNCLEAGKREKGLFRLTVPTGGGKTVASLAFALRHAVHNNMDRIIYVIPYTSIIEQNAQIFRSILGDENVLESHCNVDYGDSEEWNPMKLAAENWDKPVVVTTNVQFFESLFGNKSSKCRKLHNIANSVVIFDEVQMLPADYLKPCIAMIEELVSSFGVSAVLCTATQPALQPFFQSGISAYELCPRMEEQFAFFKRTTFQNLNKISEEDLIEKLSGEYQALCIVNTKKKAQALYKALKGQGVFHLSTSMYPKHRKRVLEEVRRCLNNGERCLVLSTSLVEAGVDLDFQSVYRQLAGIDSVIQAAGRCNREGKRSPEESNVYVFRFEEQERILGQRKQIEAAKTLVSEGKDISALETIEEYFKFLYHLKSSELDKKNIMAQFKGIKCNFPKVAEDFKMIENDTKTVFIPIEEEAQDLLQQLKYQGFTKTSMRKAGQYSVTLYDDVIEKMEAAGMIELVAENINDFYELKDKERYTEEFGLDLNIENGMALFW
ncbi:CRISPR-associated nuclease/helicase Cas3 [uncultured Blautia sp.]